jgi:hypothetical protein
MSPALHTDLEGHLQRPDEQVLPLMQPTNPGSIKPATAATATVLPIRHPNMHLTVTMLSP